MEVADTDNLVQSIRTLCQQKNAIIMAHYYTRPEIQDVAHFIGDSLALAQKANQTNADIIVMCGVHFMGETVKILCPEKKVLIPDMQAGCSLADSCKADDLAKFKAEHPNHMVVSYVNTSAEVKALTDVVVTSSNAKKIVDLLPPDTPIIFGPDRNLGSYINTVTGRKMLLWDGACHVHSRFSLEGLLSLKQQYPSAPVLAHPECKAIILAQANKIGSTKELLNFAIQSPQNQFIIATESGILYEMQKACPNKIFIPVPPEKTEVPSYDALSSTSISQEMHNKCGCQCNICEYMRLNTLEKLYECLLHEQPEIEVNSVIADRAILPIRRMLDMSK